MDRKTTSLLMEEVSRMSYELGKARRDVWGLEKENKNLKEDIDIILKGMDCLREELIKAKDEVKGLTDIIEEQVVTIKGLNETIDRYKRQSLVDFWDKMVIRDNDMSSIDTPEKCLKALLSSQPPEQVSIKDITFF